VPNKAELRKLPCLSTILLFEMFIFLKEEFIFAKSSKKEGKHGASDHRTEKDIEATTQG
jgi:hypothetical protein